MSESEPIGKLIQKIQALEKENARQKMELQKLQTSRKPAVGLPTSISLPIASQEDHFSDDVFRQLLDGSEQGTWTWDLENDLVLPDNFWFDILGYDPAKEEFGLDWWIEHLHPDSQLMFDKVLKDYLEGNVSRYELEYRIKAANGDWLWFWTRGVVTDYFEEGIPARMVGIYRQITKRKAFERKLKEVDERYAALFERSRDAVFVHDLEGRFLDANPAALDLTGYKPKEVESITLGTLLHESSFPLAMDVLQEVVNTGFQEGFAEYKIRSKQGEMLWVESKSSLIVKDGKPYAIQGIARDITERKRSEKQVMQTNLLLTSLIESPSNMIIYALDHEYRFTTFNGALAREMKEKLGASVVVGTNILEILPDDDSRQRLKENLDQALRGIRLTRVECYGEPEQQDWYESSYNPIYDKNGDVFGITVFVSVITDRIVTQEKLNEQEAIFRALVEKSPDIIIRMDRNLKLVYVNPAFSWFTEIPFIELVGKDSSQLDLAQESFHILEGYVKEVLTSRMACTAEFYYLRKEERVYFQARIVPELDQQGTVEYVLCVLRDITELKRVEEQLQAAQSKLEERVSKRTSQLTLANVQLRREVATRKQVEEKLIFAKHHAELSNKFKTEFLANISHELRTPMHHILNYSKFGIEKINNPKEKLKHYFTQIRLTGERLLYLVNQLLDLSKLESGKMDYSMSLSDLKEIVAGSVQELSSLAEEKQVKIIIDESIGDTSVECDGYKIGQVVRNLLSNSIKFTPEGKTIHLSFSDGKLNIKMKTVAAVMISVSDQGIGIPSQEIRSVFEKFVQSSTTKTGAGGTGLGLAISKRIIEDHKGRIWAQNNADTGVTVSFLIPRNQKDLIE